MPTIQICHEITASSSYRSLTVNLQVTHTIDALKPSPKAVKIQASFVPWLQTVEFGSELDISLACAIEGTTVPCRHLRTFPFVSDIVTALRETCYDAENNSSDDYTDDVVDDSVLRHRFNFEGPRTKVDRRLCLRKLDLVFCLPSAISDLAPGVNAPNMYTMLNVRPPLPLQICFDDIVAQLLSHMARSYPRLFGQHSTPLQRNAQFITSSLDSMLRIMGNSSNKQIKTMVGRTYQGMLSNAQSVEESQGVFSAAAYASGGGAVLSGSTIEDPAANIHWTSEDVARNLTQRMYSTRMKIEPQEEQKRGKAHSSDIGEDLGIHEDLPETTVEEPIEEDYFGEDPIVGYGSDEDYRMADNSSLSSPAPSILDMDSPPTSPSWNPIDLKLSADASPLLNLDDDMEDMFVDEMLDLD
ncbi:hypothetical protein BDV93DRAFT_605057 [Ceratobasidium sp. AG-I]|nr:hypothetical protein BDV93DRAFT_605057 [Ceratobasidium sp. AG-I]